MYNTTSDALAAAYQAIADLELTVVGPSTWGDREGPGILEDAFVEAATANGLDADGGVSWPLRQGSRDGWSIHIDRVVAGSPAHAGAHEPQWELPAHGCVISIREPGQRGRDFQFVVTDLPAAPSDATTLCRQWARGIYATEAAVELLARGLKPEMLRSDRPWVRTSEIGNTTYVDAKRLLEYTGGWSSGETLVVDVALSLLDDEPFKLSDIARRDGTHTRLVLAAIAHASGVYAGDLKRDPSDEFEGLLNRL